MITLFKRKKLYQYIDIAEERSLYGQYVMVEKGGKTIHAKTDEKAYLKAYINYRMEVKMHQDLFKLLERVHTRPIGFKLLNQSGENIAASIDFTNKEAIERAIEEKIANAKPFGRKIN
ncbi:hypothetical protein H8S90_05800 [Olivibacter sp. SDN3]|uniref:hypothetical protein n=1 Tax=Olivibacter sp. SDN3 TaxID=2764720 RepID=UPI001651AA60|nr:hypothetical protein [Olivibacter sp. SDN3]QNL51097.1 hypothetical protein H8S90_05800 [Olivibacter sp. SDN3]